MDRRQFIKTGLIGATVLGAAGWLSHGTFWGGPSRTARTADYGYRFFTGSDLVAMSAIAAVILEGAGASGPRPKEVIRDMDSAIADMLPETQAELRGLMNLLTFPVTRMLLTGVWSSWSSARKTTIAAFLTSWNNSRFELFKSAYDGLVQLTMASYYGNPKSWVEIGYAGPPKLF